MPTTPARARTRSGGATRSGERHRRELGVLDAGARVRRVDDHALADVQPDVADAAVEEDEVARLQLGAGHGPPVAELGLRGAVQADAGRLPGPEGQAGAVERVRAGGAEDVRLAELLLGPLEGGESLAARTGVRGRVGRRAQ